MFCVPDEFLRSIDYDDIFFKDLEGARYWKCVHCQLQSQNSLGESLKLLLFVRTMQVYFVDLLVSYINLFYLKWCQQKIKSRTLRFLLNGSIFRGLEKMVVGSVVFFHLFSRRVCAQLVCYSNNLLTILTVQTGDWCCQLLLDGL